MDSKERNEHKTPSIDSLVTDWVSVFQNVDTFQNIKVESVNRETS